MEFNWLTFNGVAAPATTPMIVRQGNRVRLRIVNLGMDHHPIHLHGHQFYVTRSEEHTSELQSRLHLVCRLLLEKKKTAAPQPLSCRQLTARHAAATGWCSITG